MATAAQLEANRLASSNRRRSLRLPPAGWRTRRDRRSPLLPICHPGRMAVPRRSRPWGTNRAKRSQSAGPAADDGMGRQGRRGPGDTGGTRLPLRQTNPICGPKGGSNGADRRAMPALSPRICAKRTQFGQGPKGGQVLFEKGVTANRPGKERRKNEANSRRSPTFELCRGGPLCLPIRRVATGGRPYEPAVCIWHVARGILDSWPKNAGGRLAHPSQGHPRCAAALRAWPCRHRRSRPCYGILRNKPNWVRRKSGASP